MKRKIVAASMAAVMLFGNVPVGAIYAEDTVSVVVENAAQPAAAENGNTQPIAVENNGALQPTNDAANANNTAATAVSAPTVEAANALTEVAPAAVRAIEPTAVRTPVNYSATTKFIGQWTGESNKIVETEKTFATGDEKLGEPAPNYGALRHLAKTFLGWSDKPPVENGKLAEGARLFSAEDTVAKAFPNGIPADAKLYGVYFSLNDPLKPFTDFDAIGMMSTIGDLPISSNKVTIDTHLKADEVLPDTKLKEVTKTGAIIDVYSKKDDTNTINEVILEAEFEMDPTVAMLVYKNPVGSNAFRPILSYDYNTRYQNGDFTTNDGKTGYTYVDLVVKLDERLNVPEKLYMNFKGYSWRPLYVLDENKEKLEIFDPKTGASLGNTTDSFSALVNNIDPSVIFGVNTAGKKNLTIRTVLREGEKEKIKESTVTPDVDGTIAEKILENMKLTALSKKVLKALLPDKEETELNKMVVTVSDAVAKELAATQGKETLKMTGAVKGNAVASAGSISRSIFGIPITLPLRHEAEIKQADANVVELGYVKKRKPTPDPQPNPEPKPTPDPQPNPEPKPTPDPQPSPEPKPTPDPQPSPEPKPTPDPQPKPEPKPTPDPQPNPEPTPTPDLQPKSNPQPVPQAVQQKTTVKSETPETGDTSNPLPYGMLLAASGFGLFVSNRLRKKQIKSSR